MFEWKKRINNLLDWFYFETLPRGLTLGFAVSFFVLSAILYIFEVKLPVENARYFLSAMIQSLATILVLIVTISSIAVQITSQNYSPRIFKIFTRNRVFINLFLLYSFSILVTSVILIIITGDFVGPNHILIPLFAFTLCLLYLPPYTTEIFNLIRPGSLIIKITNDLDSNFLKEIKSEKEIQPDDDPLQAVIDMVTNATRRGDVVTARIGIKSLIKQFKNLTEISGNVDKRVLDYFLKESKNLVDVSYHDELLLINALDLLQTLAEEAIKLDLDNTTRYFLWPIENVGEKAIEQKYREIPLFVLHYLGRLGLKGVKMDLINTCIASIAYIELIIFQLNLDPDASSILDMAFSPTVESLEDIGKAAKEKKLSVAQIDLVQPLGEIRSQNLQRLLELRYEDPDPNKKVLLHEETISLLKKFENIALERGLKGRVEEIRTAIKNIQEN